MHRREIFGFIPYESPTRPRNDRKGKPYRMRLETRSLGKSLAGADVRLLVEHGDADKRAYARTADGTLRLTETDGGLEWRAMLPDDRQAGGLWRAIRRGRFTKCSPGFTVEEVRWLPGERMESIQRARLEEISLAGENAACPDTSCEAVRTLAAWVPRQVELAAAAAEEEMRASLRLGFASNALDRARRFFAECRAELLPEEEAECRAIVDDMLRPAGLRLDPPTWRQPLTPVRQGYAPEPQAACFV